MSNDPSGKINIKSLKHPVSQTTISIGAALAVLLFFYNEFKETKIRDEAKIVQLTEIIIKLDTLLSMESDLRKLELRVAEQQGRLMAFKDVVHLMSQDHAGIRERVGITEQLQERYHGK